MAHQNAPNEATENVFIDFAVRRRRSVRSGIRRTKPTRYANMRRTKPPRMFVSVVRPDVATVRGQQRADVPDQGGEYATNEPNSPGDIAPYQPNFRTVDGFLPNEPNFGGACSQGERAPTGAAKCSRRFLRNEPICRGKSRPSSTYEPISDVLRALRSRRSHRTESPAGVSGTSSSVQNEIDQTNPRDPFGGRGW